MRRTATRRSSVNGRGMPRLAFAANRDFVRDLVEVPVSFEGVAFGVDVALFLVGVCLGLPILLPVELELIREKR